MKAKSTTQRRALFTIVGGMVVINPAFAQQPATSPVASQTRSETLEEVVVTGLRASLQTSMDIKRTAVGVVDAIAAEDMGKFPDTNLAESLQRITGISIDRRNGEGAQVTARGFGPQFNLVTLNGRQIPGADGFGNGEITIGGQGSGTRSFNFAQLAPEAVTSVEVYKTSRADLPSGGIGARQWSGDERISDAEDENVHAKPDAERRARQQAESGIAHEESQPEPCILVELIQEGQAVSVTVELPRLLSAAELREREPPRFRGVPARADELVDVKLEMAVELGIEVVNGSCSCEQATQPAKGREPAPHGVTGRTLSSLAPRGHPDPGGRPRR